MKLNSIHINPQTGLLKNADYQPSPHHDERPADAVIDMIVIHNISLPPGEFGSSAISDFFCGRLDTSLHPYYATIAQLRVSAHLLIQRDGRCIQFVPFTKRAWHAGESTFEGRVRCNDFSIGIELEGTDEISYTEAQYQQLAAIILVLMQTYTAITQERIVGHVDIAPARKTDPGRAFDWHYLRGKLV